MSAKKGAPAPKRAVALPVKVAKPKTPAKQNEAPAALLLDAEKPKRAPTQAELSKIAALADELGRCADYVMRGEEAIKLKKARMLEIQTHDLVDIMDAVGMDHMGLAAHEADITVRTKYHANLPSLPEPHKDDYAEKFERRQRGLQWLKDEEHDGVINVELVVTFPRGQAQRAYQMQEEMHQRAEEYARHHDGEQPFRLETTESVPWATLTKLVKSLTEEKGRTDLPLADLGASIFRMAEIKPRSERKKTTTK